MFVYPSSCVIVSLTRRSLILLGLHLEMAFILDLQVPDTHVNEFKWVFTGNSFPNHPAST